MRLLASAVALMAAASTLLVAAAKHPLTPEDLILAPKTAHEFALSPSHNHIAYPVSYSSLDKGGKTRKEVHVIEVPSSDDLATGPQLQRSSSPTVLHDVGYAAWIDDEHLVYVNYSALYTLALSDSNSPVKLLDLPAPIAEDSLRVVAGKGNADRHLVFAAEVYQDGELEGVKRVESEENEEEWGRVKAYDGDNGAFFRHWDSWNRPGKRSNLFSLALASSKSSSSSSWVLGQDASPINLLKGSNVSTPIAPFGGLDHWDVHPSSGIVFVSKTPALPAAWHTRGEVYHVPSLDEPGKIAQLTPKDGEHGAVTSPRFSPNGKHVAWLQMATDGYESDRNVVQVYDLAAKKQKALLQKWDRSPSALEWSADGTKLFLVTEDHQRVKVYSFDPFARPKASSPTLVAMPQLKSGSITHFASTRLDDGDLSLFVSSSLRSVSEVYLHRHSTQASYLLTTFSHGQGSSLRDVEWPSKAPEAFHYPSPDHADEKRWGWIHTPPGYDDDKDATASGKWPLLLLIHGGPEGAWTDSWSTRWNPEVFAAQGYLVITLNPTGSTGFGQKLTRSILNDWGGAPYRDILAGVKHVLKREKGKVDENRVAAAGASYGGYMINWLQGHNEEGLFKALVCHDGVFDPAGSWWSGDELYFPEHEFGGSGSGSVSTSDGVAGLPWTSPASYNRWSPSNHVGNWKTPQLVVHGAKDWRLTPDNGVSVFNALRRRGVETRLVYFEGEGHWVLDPQSSRRWHSEVLGWVERWIGKGKGRGKSREGDTVLVEKAQEEGEVTDAHPAAGGGGGQVVFAAA